MSAAIANSHRICSIWAPPSPRTVSPRPRGMRSVTWTPSSTRCWRNWRPWRQTVRGEDRPGPKPPLSGAALRKAIMAIWCVDVLRPAVAGDRPAVRHSVRHALLPVRPLDPARAVAPPAQPLDPGLAAGLRRHSGTQRRHPRQPVVSLQRRLASGAASTAARRSRASRSISRWTSTASRWRSPSRRQTA